MEVRTVEHKDIERTVAPEEVVSVNFIEAIINKDNETGKYGGRVLTRFPPGTKWSTYTLVMLNSNLP